MLLRVVAFLPLLLAPVASLAQGTLPAIQSATAPPVANPYGLAALWAQGDIVARATLVILALMSLASWYVLIAKVDLNTWVAQSIERAVATVHSRTQEGLAVLATVGSTAPFVGLFGTVWG